MMMRKVRVRSNHTKLCFKIRKVLPQSPKTERISILAKAIQIKIIKLARKSAIKPICKCTIQKAAMKT